MPLRANDTPNVDKKGFLSSQKHADVVCCFSGSESFSSDTRLHLSVSCLQLCNRMDLC